MEHVSHNYNKLNDYLVKNVENSDDFEENIKMAETLLDEENKNPTMWNKKFRQQLENFIKLKIVDDYDNCDEISYQIVSDNNEFTNNRAGDLGAEFGKLRRVDRIVNQQLRNHISNCWSKYYDLYRYDRLKLDDQLKAEFAERFIDNVIEFNRPNKDDRKYYYDKDQIYRFMLNIGTIEGADSAKAALRSMREFARETREPEGIYLSRYLDERKGIMVKPSQEKVKKYYQLYIVDSCEYYVTKLGNRIKPIIYDYNFLYRNDRDQVDRDLFAAMSYFKLCQIFLDEKKNSLLSDIIKVIKSDNDNEELPNVVRKPIRDQILEDKEKFKNNLLDDKKYNKETFKVNFRHNFSKFNKKGKQMQPEDTEEEVEVDDNDNKNNAEKYDYFDYPSEEDD